MSDNTSKPSHISGPLPDETKRHNAHDAHGLGPVVPSEPGNGLVEGTAASDVIDVNYLGDPEGDRIDNGDALLPGAAPEDDLVLAGAGDDTVIAGLGNDEVFGEIGDDVIDGGADDDTLIGGKGDDTITGGSGNDWIDGGIGDDVIDGGADADTILGGVGEDTITGGAGNDVIRGDTGEDVIDGGSGADTILAGAGEDIVTGGSGNDVIIGGDGADTLLGRDDRDIFVGATDGDFIDGGEGGEDFDILDLRGSGPLEVILDADNPENGLVNFFDGDRNVTGTATFRNIEKIVPCFTPGILIATPEGERRVETLRVGDKIVTRDNGLQEIRWIGHKQMDWPAFAASPHLKPILIQQGALGNGLPERDMMVSPNHRMLVANERTALYFDEHEVLVAAKHLVNHRGVHPIETVGTTYIHFICDRHEVVLANGAWTESFQPGDETLKGMGNSQRAEIFELFPYLKTAIGRKKYGSVRKTLKKFEASLLGR
jgi:hypothetical protein